MFRTAIICALLISMTGCASMTSMIMNRDDHDVFTKNSRKKQKGVPVTVRVPTHLKVKIEEEYYLAKQDNETLPPKEVFVDKPIRFIEYRWDYEDKIFMVDLKRPGVGTINTDIQIDPETQYFKAIKGKVVDNTIREITQIANQFGIQFAKKTTGTLSDRAKKDLIVDTRTVAFGRFDVNAVDFEQQLELFFDKHINNCNRCDTRDGDQ